MNTLKDIKLHLDELTMDQVSYGEADIIAGNFNEILSKAKVAVTSPDSLQTQCLKALHECDTALRLISLAGFGKASGTCPETGYNLYSPTWVFKYDNGPTISLMGTVKDMGFDGDELESYELLIGEEDITEYLDNGDACDDLDGFICADYMTPLSFNRYRKQLDESDIHEAAALLGVGR